MTAEPPAIRTFLRIVEVWLPTDDGQLLELDGGIFGGVAGFEAMTRMMCFSANEGLPGQTWASGAPMLIRPIEGSEFRRSRAVRLAGLRCTVALPIHHAGRITSIVVLLFGESAPHRGTIEVWRDDATRPSGVALVDAYDGTIEGEASPREGRRRNLDGARSDGAAAIRLLDDGCALSLPCSSPDGASWTLDLFASSARPVALRIEIWSPAAGGAGMARAAGWCSTDGALPVGEDSARPDRVLGPIERAHRSGVAWAGPVDRAGIDPVFPFDHVLAMPVSRADGSTDVVALHF